MGRCWVYVWGFYPHHNAVTFGGDVPQPELYRLAVLCCVLVAAFQPGLQVLVRMLVCQALWRLSTRVCKHTHTISDRARFCGLQTAPRFFTD